MTHISSSERAGEAGRTALTDSEIFYLHCHGIERLRSERSENLKLARLVRCSEPKIYRAAVERAKYWHNVIRRAALSAKDGR
jgi:hypothetical protein